MTPLAMQALAPARLFGLASLGTLFGVISFVYTMLKNDHLINMIDQVIAYA